MVWSTTIPPIAAAFLGPLVEVAEAFTTVLAVALTRGWRPALIGSARVLALLVLIVLIFRPALALVQFVVGVLAILFGMRWLRKAILCSAGWIAVKAGAAVHRPGRGCDEVCVQHSTTIAGARKIPAAAVPDLLKLGYQAM